MAEVPVFQGPLAPLLEPLTADALFEESEIALQVVDADTGEELYAYNADKALNPASVMKVLTSAAALKTLGPAFRFYTSFYRDGEVTSEGTLEGNLYVKSTGDPTMVVETLWKLARELELDGIVKIDGDVVFDDSFFDRDSLVAGWRKPTDLATGPAYFAPIGALSVNYNAVCIVMAPGAEPGAPARVELDTPSDEVEIVNELVTGATGSKAWSRLEREIDEQTHHLRFTVQGSIPQDAEVAREYRSIDQPLPYYMSVFRQVLEDRGVPVKGRFREGTVPAEAEAVVTHMSKPLSEILNHQNKYSSNFLAEHVLKALGAEVHGVPGTTAKGLMVVRDYLTSLGIPESEYTLVNGSGLSRDVLLRPAHVNAVLLDMYADRVHGPEFLSSLAIAGVDGTLRHRFDADGQVGRVRGKTGSLDSVYCLAGYVESADGHMYAYALFVNGFRRVRPVRALHDRLGDALLAAGSAPPPDAPPDAHP